MKRMMFLGALVLGVTVCSQSFGFELLNKMLSHKGCTSCCEPDCGAGNGCAGACEPGCGAGNGCAEPACGAGNGCAEPACDAGNGCCEPACGASSCTGLRKCKKHDLFGGLKGLFEKCKRKHRSCTGCCEPACGAGNGCAEPACGAGNGCAEPACGAGNGCAEPACDAGNGCCEPSCGAAAGCCSKRKCPTPIRDLLKAIHAAKKARKSCTGCCGSEPDCSAGNGCCEPGCGAEPACGAGNGCAEAAPTPDASASVKTQTKVVAVSRTVSAK